MRVLVVEDEPLLREQLTGALDAAGYAVDGAASGDRADFLARTEDYDAVVLDLGNVLVFHDNALLFRRLGERFGRPAEDAARAVESMSEAINRGALAGETLLSERPTNVFKEIVIGTGDPAPGFARAEVIVEGTYHT
ncbi:MAG: response regulator, partial [Vicinamibacteria bacterium]